jgi:arylsulfotransferase ASST
MTSRKSSWFRSAWFVASLALAPCAAAQSPEHALGYEYISPAPDAMQILPGADIILRPGGIVDPASVLPGLVRVQGSVSGVLDGDLRLSDDNRTLTFTATVPFTPGERVKCAIGPGLETDTMGSVPPEQFSFTVAGPERDALTQMPGLLDGDLPSISPGGSVRLDSIPDPSPLAIPSDFPHITASVFGTPAPGRLFLSSIDFFHPSGSYLMILENDGTPVFLRKIPGLGLDFKLEPGGRLTYYDNSSRCFYVLNPLYAVVDSFRCGNGYVTDGHDLVLLPNGHALLMSYDPEWVPLDPSKTGLAFGIAIGLIIQELDQAKNVVFQWRSWDHFLISDMVGRNFSGGGIDYVHGNSLDVDPDGNIILSSRSMDEVTKISRTTGEILWRLGGKNNQFTFLDDPIPFSHQHAVRLLPNGHLVLFDNGNVTHPLFSRAVEYALDETAKSATLVWQYRLNPDVFAPAFGYVQRFLNGNTLIAWGATTPTLTEVAPDGSVVSQLTFDTGVDTYRAFRFEWPPVEPALVTYQPGTINMGSTGGPLKAVLEPAGPGFLAADILIPTVRLNGTVRPSAANFVPGDANLDSIPDVTVQFPRDVLDPMLTIGANRLVVTGSLRNGETFRGSALVKVVTNSSSQPRAASVHIVSPPGTLPVEIAAGGAPGKARTLAVYDIQGRLVKRWTVAAGGRASWDGAGSDGRRAGTGIYLIRSESGPPAAAAKVAIIR